jgi:hypothetical protein
MVLGMQVGSGWGHDERDGAYQTSASTTEAPGWQRSILGYRMLVTQ